MEAVPRVDAPLPTWSWVPTVRRPLDWSIGGSRPHNNDEFLAAANAAGLTLPASFVDFIRDPDLANAIRSSTGCWWSLDASSIGVSTEGEHRLVRFLNDQQDVLFWYLLVDDNAEPAVVASYCDFTYDDPEAPPMPTDIWRCAPDFHTFMYRMWLEDEVRFRYRAGEPLSEDQTRYLSDAQRLHSESARIHVTFPGTD